MNALITGGSDPDQLKWTGLCVRLYERASKRRMGMCMLKHTFDSSQLKEIKNAILHRMYEVYEWNKSRLNAVIHLDSHQ